MVSTGLSITKLPGRVVDIAGRYLTLPPELPNAAREDITKMSGK